MKSRTHTILLTQSHFFLPASLWCRVVRKARAVLLAPHWRNSTLPPGRQVFPGALRPEGTATKLLRGSLKCNKGLHSTHLHTWFLGILQDYTLTRSVLERVVSSVEPGCSLGLCLRRCLAS